MPRSTSATATSTRRRCTPTRPRWARRSAPTPCRATRSSSPPRSGRTTSRDGQMQRAAEASLKRLERRQVDLLLIHWPSHGRAAPRADRRALRGEAERAHAPHRRLEFSAALYRGGGARRRRADRHQPDRASSLSRPERALRDLRKHGIVITSYCPLGRSKLLRDPVVAEIAAAKGKTPAQIVLRWHVQQPKNIAIPKSSNPERIAENFAIFDFALAPEEMAAHLGAGAAGRAHGGRRGRARLERRAAHLIQARRASDPIATADVVRLLAAERGCAKAERLSFVRVPPLVTNARHPIWLPAATQPGAWAFAILYSVESISRASLASIVPIQAYDILQDEQAVSLLYFAVGVAGIAATLFAPLLFRIDPAPLRLYRRRADAGGCERRTCHQHAGRPGGGHVLPRVRREHARRSCSTSTSWNTSRSTRSCGRNRCGSLCRRSHGRRGRPSASGSMSASGRLRLISGARSGRSS